MPDNSPADEAWRQQSIWSQTANRMKASIGRARTTSLALTVTSAVSATLAGAVTGIAPAGRSALAVAATVGVGLVPLLRPRWSGSVLRDWTRARSVSEALKSEVFLYLARAGDYAGPDRDDRLVKVSETVLRDAADLLRHRTGIEPVRRALPEVHDYRSYLEVRADAQMNGYYEPRARGIQARLAQFRRVEVTLAAIGVVLGAIAVVRPDRSLGVWIAVVTTVGATLAAHVAAARYEYQLVEYLRTADELARLRRAAARTDSPAELDVLVQQCERVISIQNEGWMAKFVGDADAQPTS
ncbi:DUF4231 domain-containing protein [Planosporangium sp. 12N6]|uniref:DUF4231 domain-containing protein n=1 Tax=Planosporangium spinosum TaxID=3402278 RepID=UPI003CFB2F29